MTGNIKGEPAKAGLLTFTSPLNMDAGNHLRLLVNGKGLFGGQVAKEQVKRMISIVTRHLTINITS